jgi:hypothetical protein
MNGIPLRSIIGVNRSLKVFAGSLREIHVSITGTPDNYAVELLLVHGLEASCSLEQLD